MRRSKIKVRTVLRISDSLHKLILNDLERPHPHAWERVGFLYTKSKWVDKETLLIIATSYDPVEEEDYLVDNSVGAKIGANAIRKAMQNIFTRKSGGFHIHLHNHDGKPSPSGTDVKSLPGVVSSLSNISAQQATGYIIFSKNNFFTAIQIPGESTLQEADQVTIVGFPLRIHLNGSERSLRNKVFDRQSFLGPESQKLFENIRVAIAGYGGGGSHVGQQLAHIGVKYPVVFDGDHIEDTNLNRLVGGRWKDVINSIAKTAIAKRVIKAIYPLSRVETIEGRWQDAPEKLQKCDVAVGCVDTYAERQQLEAECRRYLIPYIDIGMDVYPADKDEPPSMSGQVMLSMPGMPCFSCYGFLTEEKLGKEAAKYGDVGGRPQVVWPNGVLASTAVGILVELITGWTKRKDAKIYLEYDGNSGILKDHIRSRFCDETCSHYPLEQAGPVIFKPL